MVLRASSLNREGEPTLGESGEGDSLRGCPLASSAEPIPRPGGNGSSRLLDQDTTKVDVTDPGDGASYSLGPPERSEGTSPVEAMNWVVANRGKSDTRGADHRGPGVNHLETPQPSSGGALACSILASMAWSSNT